MKKRGFTLIELLAVIVVLAIIALIATPIVMNVIKNAQKGAVERSAERYVDAVETAIATDRLENGLIADGIYTVDADGNLVLGDKTLTVEVNGDRPAAGSTVAIENGQVVPTGTSMTIGDYTVTINDKGSATAIAAGDVVALCNAIAPTEQDVFDDGEWVMTTATAGVQATSADPYALGAVYSCELGDGVSRTFYVLGTDGDNVKLIMNENLGNTVAWCDQNGDNPDDNVCAADGANAYLASQTSGWAKLSQSQITLPSYDDMSSVQGQTWMRTNLDADNSEYAYGYWTSTPDSDGSSDAWHVGYSGYLHNFRGVDYVYDIGVRPVITIEKTNMSL